MSLTSRRERIEAMLAEEPDDVFLRYSLALELEKEGRHEDSLEHLQGLMAASPPHVPSFFMAGQHLARQSRTPEARTVLTHGIQHAELQGEDHAAREMREFLDGLAELS